MCRVLGVSRSVFTPGRTGGCGSEASRTAVVAIGAVDRDAAGALDRALAFDYTRPNDKPDCRWRERAERERMLTRVAQDASGRCGPSSTPTDCSATTRSPTRIGCCASAIGQDFDVDEDGVAQLARGTRSDRIISTVDPEMRHGRKSQHQRFDGFKPSAAVTNTPQPLITAVDVAPASRPDGPRAKHLINAQPPARRPPRVLGDTAYGIRPVRAELAERGSMCSRRCRPRRSSPAGWPSAILPSIRPPAPSPTRPARSPRSGPSPPGRGAPG